MPPPQLSWPPRLGFERFDAGSMGKEAAEDLHALDRAARLHAQCDGGQVDDDAFDERLALPTIGLETAANLDFSDGLAHPLTCRIALPQETGFRRRLGAGHTIRMSHHA